MLNVNDSIVQKHLLLQLQMLIKVGSCFISVCDPWSACFSYCNLLFGVFCCCFYPNVIIGNIFARERQSVFFKFLTFQVTHILIFGFQVQSQVTGVKVQLELQQIFLHFAESHLKSLNEWFKSTHTHTYKSCFFSLKN